MDSSPAQTGTGKTAWRSGPLINATWRLTRVLRERYSHDFADNPWIVEDLRKSLREVFEGILPAGSEKAVAMLTQMCLIEVARRPLDPWEIRKMDAAMRAGAGNAR